MMGEVIQMFPGSTYSSWTGISVGVGTPVPIYAETKWADGGHADRGHRVLCDIYHGLGDVFRTTATSTIYGFDARYYLRVR